MNNINRIEIVMKALGVDDIDDAKRIIEHLTKHNCLDWIDNYKEENRDNEPLVDVHYESDFKDVIDWQYEDCRPSDMLGMSTNIEDYPEMLELTYEVIFWYGLV